MIKITALILTALAFIACNEKEVSTQEAPQATEVKPASAEKMNDNSIAEVETLEKELETLLEEI